MVYSLSKSQRNEQVTLHKTDSSLERIIEIASNENDPILDPFCGSGTHIGGSKTFKSSRTGIDVSEDAIDISRNGENPINLNQIYSLRTGSLQKC